MGIASINFNEYTVGGTLKKRQGSRVKRFRKLLEKDKIQYTETMTVGVFTWGNDL